MFKAFLLKPAPFFKPFAGRQHRHSCHFFSFSRSALAMFSASPFFVTSHTLRYIWQELSFSITLQWISYHSHFVQAMTRALLQSSTVPWCNLSPLVSTHYFSRTDQNCSTHRSISIHLETGASSTCSLCPLCSSLHRTQLFAKFFSAQLISSCSACDHTIQNTFHLIMHGSGTDSLHRLFLSDSLSLYDRWSRFEEVSISEICGHFMLNCSAFSIKRRVSCLPWLSLGLGDDWRGASRSGDVSLAIFIASVSGSESLASFTNHFFHFSGPPGFRMAFDTAEKNGRFGRIEC